MHYQNQLKYLLETTKIHNLPQDASGFIAINIFINFLLNKTADDLLFLVNNENEIEIANQQLNFFLNSFNASNSQKDLLNSEIRPEILEFPAWDVEPFDYLSPNGTILNRRIKTLYKLATRNEGQKFIVIATIKSLIQKTIPSSKIKNLGLFLQVGSKISLEEISNFLVLEGYNRSATASTTASFALRGGIIDLVIEELGEMVGYRLDFFGEELESIKIFDPISQISQYQVKQINILPASEILINPTNVNNFRSKYRLLFGSDINNILYRNISESRPAVGMEHFLPLFYNCELASLFDYLRRSILFASHKIAEQIYAEDANIVKNHQERLAEQNFNKSNFRKNNDSKNNDFGSNLPLISRTELYFNHHEINDLIKQNICLIYSENQGFLPMWDDLNRSIDFNFTAVPEFLLASRQKKLETATICKDFLENKAPIQIIITSNSQIANKINNDLLLENLHFQEIDLSHGNKAENSSIDIKNLAKNGNKNLRFLGNLPRQILFSNGFETADFIIIGEKAFYGEKLPFSKKPQQNLEKIIAEGIAIQEGELVVHRHYGIGKFLGLQQINIGKITCEMLQIGFAEGDNLFVGAEDINLISRYGADNNLIELDRLHGGNWQKRRQKIRQRIKVNAAQLLEIAAKRQLIEAPVFTSDSLDYQEFVANFPFTETEDQLKAITEIAEDLASGKLTDRLICGDVGFGKTEVAMRAAAMVIFTKVISSQEKEGSSNEENRQKKPQVAIIVPTTLLCRQHYQSFCHRFAKHNINIAQISRMLTASEIKRTKADLANGNIDIIIGTHALLQDKIEFNNLALAIIDEEQHFGVVQKEKIKNLSNNVVHLLTLSATPIPRTLQMSLSGVKDLSIIATPPVARIPVKNIVSEFSGKIVKDAILREYNRGGKVFIVAPRIKDVDELTPQLIKWIPELKIKSANGRIKPEDLENIIADFVDDKIDVLVSTTIIESGLDIKNANTIILYKAENFGLAQLYQLRGRVGRGKIRGYAYFLTARKNPKEESQKKLTIIENINSLGGGFNIATHDMDLRGSGNLIGDEQSGHIKETGAELYQQMLVEEISKIKKLQAEGLDLASITRKIANENEELSPDIGKINIKIGISALIPSEYIAETSLRLSFYKKIANSQSQKELEDIAFEMADRFGKLPIEVIHFIAFSELKILAKELNIAKVETANQQIAGKSRIGIAVSFQDNNFAKIDKIFELVSANAKDIKFYQEQNILQNSAESKRIQWLFFAINDFTSQNDGNKILATKQKIMLLANL